MRKLFSVLLIGCIIMLSGCPYDSPVALNTYDDAEKIDKSLMGKWTVFHEDGSFDKIRIDKGDKTVFHVQHDVYDEEGKKQENYYYRAFSTRINDFQIFNLEKKDHKYNLYRFNRNGKDEFVLDGINEEFIEANFEHAEQPTANQLRYFIESNTGNPDMFDDPLVFYREGSKGHAKKAK